MRKGIIAVAFLAAFAAAIALPSATVAAGGCKDFGQGVSSTASQLGVRWGQFVADKAPFNDEVLDTHGGRC